MTFFARPNLSDEQFKQLSGTTLTLTGETNFVGILKSKGVEIDATLGVLGDVLTYNGSKIVLSVPSSGASTGVYTCASPTTCTVGGLPAGSAISGCTISNILQSILVPTLPPALTPPSSTFCVNPSGLFFEIGCVLNPVGCITYNPGCINPQYTSACNKRSNGSISFIFQDFGGGICTCSCNALNSSYPMSTYSVVAGVRSACGNVCYCAGVQPKDSSGGNSGSPLTPGTTALIGVTVCGVLPWYYGTKANNSISGADVAAGTKGNINILASTTLPIVYNSNPSDYLWFAVPSGTPVKTAWFVCASNQGVIGGSNNLFATGCPVTVTSIQGCWANCPYSVYVTCITTGTAVGVPMCMS